LLSLPQRLDASAERARLFGEHAAGDARRRLGVRGLALRDERREARAPRRQRLMRRREGEQH
jgi:hypothetical protein